MTVQDIKEILKADVLCEGDGLGAEVHTACGSDMMSDVLAFVKDQSVLLRACEFPGGAHRRNDGHGLHRLCARKAARPGDHRPRAGTRYRGDDHPIPDVRGLRAALQQWIERRL